MNDGTSPAWLHHGCQQATGATACTAHVILPP